MTGSGMGCPDWPKCFGLLIPPTSEEEIRWAPETEYSEGRMVIERDTLWIATEDHISQMGEFGTQVWKPYESHSYATFNAFHTWIEYLNRLSGALAGIPILILFILAIKSRKRMPIVLSTATLGSVLFVSWLGKLVVDGNLIPFSITIHAVSALAILAFLVMLLYFFLKVIK
jgi:cytochrome c oxidase assembly protein subunit 15